MTGKEILAEAKEKMAKSGDALKRTLADIRAGRANASLLNTVTVEYYGAPTPLNQLASITIPEARQLLISPYDKTTLKDMVKDVKAEMEKAKVAVRNVRREAMDDLKKGNKDGDFNDDEFHDLEKQVQEETDAGIKNLEQIAADKEKELLEG